jgi:integrase
MFTSYQAQGGNMQSKQGRGGDGFFKKRGIWYFRVKKYNGKYRSVSTRTRVYTEAKTIRKDHLDANRPFILVNPHMTVDQATEIWKTDHYPHIGAESKITYNRAIKRVSNELGSLPLSKIDAGVLKTYQRERLEKGAATATINGEMKCLTYVLKKQGVWPAIRGDFRFFKETETIGRVWTPEEIEKVMTEVASGKYPWYTKLAIELALETGMRHKEMSHMRRRNIDLQRKSFSVERSATKTPAGVREIPMTSKAERIAKELLEYSAALGATAPHHFVFPGYVILDGHLRVDPNRPFSGFKYAWHRLRKASGIDPDLRIHDTRHTVATDLGETDASITDAMGLMGWNSIKMMRRYQHMRKRAKRSVIANMEKMREERAKDVA